MKSRATIIISGSVQKVAYRSRVDRYAFEANLRGLVRNLEDGTVEIICEGEKADIDDFIKRIWIVEYPVRVEDVRPVFSEPTGEYKEFTLIRDQRSNGDVSDKLDKGFEYIQLMNGDLSEKLGTGFQYIQLMHKDLSGKLETVLGAIVAMDNHMGERFDRLDSKYDTFGKKMDGLGTKMDGLGTKMDGLGDTLGKKMDSLGDKIDKMGDRIENKLDGMAGDMKAMRELLTVFVEHLMKKENAEA
jgi:acylphosphatase